MFDLHESEKKKKKERNSFYSVEFPNQPHLVASTPAPNESKAAGASSNSSN